MVYRIQDTQGFTVDTVNARDEEQAVTWASKTYRRTDLVAVIVAPYVAPAPLTAAEIEALAAMDAANAAADGSSNSGDWDN